MTAKQMTIAAHRKACIDKRYAKFIMDNDIRSELDCAIAAVDLCSYSMYTNIQSWAVGLQKCTGRLIQSLNTTNRG